MGVKDIHARNFYSNDARYADIINGLIYNGQQIVKKEDVHEKDSRADSTERDLIRKVIFGINFTVIGIENQEYIDYSMPLRNMHYDVHEYEQQAAQIHKTVSENPKGLSRGEFLYRFRRESRLHPTITLILYYGEDEWDGATQLHDILDFSDIPEEMRNLVQNYQIHVIDIRKLKDTSVFHTDVKQVFDFIRYSKDKENLRNLILSDPAFHHLDIDTAKFISYYANKEYFMKLIPSDSDKGGHINMCQALDEIMQDERKAGEETGEKRGLEIGEKRGLKIGQNQGIELEKRETIRTALAANLQPEQIAAICRCSIEYINQVKSETLI